MHVLNKEAHIALRAIAMLVGVALLLWTIGAFPFTQKADAANVTSFSDTLSDSDVSVVSNHTITFTIPNGMVTGGTFTITFPAGFDLTNVVIGDVDLATSTTDQTLAASAAAGTWGYSKSGQVLTFTTPTNYGVPSSTPVTVKIGTNATGGTNRIINPTAGSYEIVVGGTMQDSGRTRVAIIDDVLVTATVNTSFTFSIIGLNSSTEVNGTTTTATSTATTIPFGTLTNGVITTLAQDLTVTTNASNGFVVTVFESGPLLSSTGADIDEFSNDTDVTVPVAWSAPTNSIASENTWGHWGLTSEDDYNSDQWGSNLWMAASTTPRVVFHHASSSDGVTPNIGSTTVGYQAQITSLQEAGDDYNTTLTYIATPTF